MGQFVWTSTFRTLRVVLAEHPKHTCQAATHSTVIQCLLVRAAPQVPRLPPAPHQSRPGRPAAPAKIGEWCGGTEEAKMVLNGAPGLAPASG